jgi:uncharacterized protein YjiS (DUF1127 family)
MTTAFMRDISYSSTRADRSIATSLDRAVSFIFAALERQRTRRDLACLDDRMLRDIGLSRYEVELELRRPWWRP